MMECTSIDKLLKIYRERRKNVLKLLTQNIDQIDDLWSSGDKYLHRDTCCGKAMGINDSNNLINNIECERNIADHSTNYKCFQCASLENVLELYQENLGQPFMIECGKLKDQYLIVIHNRYPVPRIFKSDFPFHFIKNRVNYIATDYLTNHILISWLTQEKLQKSKLLTSKLYTAFMCGQESYLLSRWLPYSWLSLGTNSKTKENQALQQWFTKINNGFVLNPVLCKSAIKQIVGNLYILNKIDFICFNLTPDLFRVDNQFVFYLNNIKRAGVNVGNNRIYYYDEEMENEISRDYLHDFIKLSSQYSLHRKEKKYIKIYDLGTNHMRRSVNFFYLSQMGVIKYAYVVQYYMYLLYFMMQDFIYPLLWLEPEIYAIFARLWVSEEIERAQEEFKILIKIPDITKYDLLKFISKFTLKPALLENLYNML